MIKELQYKGYATQPSDYECPDGQSALSLNLINEDNQLKPVFQPKKIITLGGGWTVVSTHFTHTYHHYILYNTSENLLSWFDADHLPRERDTQYEAQDKAFLNLADASFTSITAIGNTLVVIASDGMHYVLWKDDTQAYASLGTHLPETPLSFGLFGDLIRGDKFTITHQNISDRTADFSDDNKTQITEQVLAKVNKFIREHSVSAGRFMYPFLVRYAYRLYDGSLTMHSAPVLMVCSTHINPVAEFMEMRNGTETDLRLCGVSCRLVYAMLANHLEGWGDIIKSVDIFISAPIYTYNQAGQCERFVTKSDYGPSSVCRQTNRSPEIEQQSLIYPLRYQVNDFGTMYAFAYDPVGFTYPQEFLELPARTQDQITADIKAASQFYLLKSIPIDQLQSSRTVIDINEDYLQSLVNRELMTDDYDSHDTLIPHYAFAYNQRLNIANITKSLYRGYNSVAPFCYTDGYVVHYADADPDALDALADYTLYFVSKHDGRDIITKGVTGQLAVYSTLLYIYSPDRSAYKAIVVRVYNGQKQTIPHDTYVKEYPLEPHAFLNGSVYFGGWDDIWTGLVGEAPTESTDRTVSLPNKIYTSETNNPFHFPVLGINTVGTGTVIGISAAAKAMSQGQFGQFPLYAFTTEGVWALEVSADGSYSARQPITRDVCINSDSITQIDTSVLFATDRGIMLISGSQTQCITDSIASEAPFNVLQLPGVEQLHTRLGHTDSTCLPVRPFLDFLAGCRMLYDYLHQRIFVYNPTTKDGAPIYTYAYVFSLKSNAWGMTYSDLSSTINAYPDALAMTHTGKLVSFSSTDDNECKGLYITRPLKLDMPDVHKTVSAVIQRGHFQRTDVATVLYASRDLYNWQLVWSSTDHYLRGFRGTPYKYFRIAALATLTEGKSIFGASVEFTPRHTNNLR